MKAKSDLMQQIVEIHNRRKKHGTAVKLARFMTKQAKRIQHSRPVVVQDGVITKRLNLASPEQAAELDPRSSMAKPRMPAPQNPETENIDEHGVFLDEAVDLSQATEPEITQSRADVPSIEDIAARNEEWED